MLSDSEQRQRYEILLKYLELPFDMVEQYFDKMELEKVQCAANESKWTFILYSSVFVPSDVFRTFLLHAKAKFNHIAVIQCSIRFRESISKSQIFEEYWNLCSEQIKQQHPSINGLLKNAKVSFANDVFSIALTDEVNLEFAKQKDLDRLIKVFFAERFFLTTEIKFSVNTERSEAIERFAHQVELEQQRFIEESTKVASMIDKNPIADSDSKLMLGYEIKDKPVSLQTITEEEKKVTVQGLVFGLDEIQTRSGTTIFQFIITDFTDSIQVKSFVKNKEDLKIMRLLKNDMWVLIRGKVEYDRFGPADRKPELALIPNDLVRIEPTMEERMDDAPEKRVEFHLHTLMSTMDAVTSISDYVKTAKKWGHEAIAITDHGGCQAYPEAMKSAKNNGIKMIYGVEANVLNEPMSVVIQPRSVVLADETYVVFDIETTSLSVTNGEMIEIAGVKMKNGEILDKFAMLVKPTGAIPDKIMQITNITNEMVAQSPMIEEVLPQFIAFVGDCTLVAHNARFDLGFIKEWCKRLGLEIPKQATIDTLEMARTFLQREMRQFNLKALSDRFKVELKSHHRALDDCIATGHIFFHLLAIAEKSNIHNMLEFDRQNVERLLQVRAFHCTIYAQNLIGLKNLYKLISMSHTEFYKKMPCIPKRKLSELRDGLIVLSGCEKGEFFETVLNKSMEEAEHVAQFYDVLEVQPLTTYQHLVEKGLVNSEQEIIDAIQKIIAIGQKLDKPVIATGNVHYLHPRHKINREIIINGIVGHSPLRDLQKPDVHFRTTEEMLNEFPFLTQEIAYDIVVRQTRMLAYRFESFPLFPDKLFTPHIEGAESEIRETCYSTAISLYGETLPEIVVKRLEKELVPIIKYGFSANYLISQRLVKKSNDNGYLVGSRGSVGSSIVAMMLGISEVNPLPPHYLCGNCKHSEWFSDGSIANGFDLADKKCPTCSTIMKGQGHDIPFETFLGFEGKKVPDIDLNFSGNFQSQAHNYTRVLFGEKNVFRAGTVGTIKDRTAYGYVKNYAEERGKSWKHAEIVRLANGCTGVKRSTGQHPGGIIVVPDTIDVEDITPVQYPADSLTAEWKTTHFDYHSFEDNLLKLDILGHDDPTMMHVLQKLTGYDPLTIPMNDAKVLSIFRSTEALGVMPEQIRSNVGTYGIPEMGTKFVRQMLEETAPVTFSDLIQISGLSHGTDVWLGNAQDLIRNRTCTIKTVIGCRDEIMLFLIYKAGMDASLAFNITESVRKGKGVKPEWKEAMKEHKVPQWYIDSCEKIKYMFPKAHAAAYVISAVRTAFYKINYPLEFYAAYFSIRVSDFDLQTMRGGYRVIAKKYEEMTQNFNQLSDVEKNVHHTLEMSLEMTARGFTFDQIDIYRSSANEFVISGKSLIPPFSALAGCGETVAQSMEEAREYGEFLSIDDFQTRSKCSKKVIELLREAGCFKGLPESNQLSLFDEL
jgi:DNA polymerase-3 subunit alpha (Gram-positive type)